MSNIPDNLKYSKEHEWVEVRDDGTVRIGVTDYAQSSLGDIVYVDISQSDEIAQGDSIGNIESVKTVSDIYAPIDGDIININEAINDDPVKVNDDPYGEGYLLEVKPTEPSQLDDLLDAKAYQELLDSL